MDQLEQVCKLADDEVVKVGLAFQDDLHRSLVLGQTRHMCRWGTLSDGHEKITDAQRYYQAIREMYHLACNIIDLKADAKLAQADLDDAASIENKLRREATQEKARLRLTRALITIKDQSRMLDEYHRVYKELKPIVEAKYPEGIEQAESDNWAAVARYRANIEQFTGMHQHLRHLPIEPKKKAELGVELDRPELVAWLATREKDKIAALAERFGMVPGTNKAPDPKALVRQLIAEGGRDENLLAPVR